MNDMNEKMKINIAIVEALKDLSPDDRKAWKNEAIARYPQFEPAADVLISAAERE